MELTSKHLDSGQMCGYGECRKQVANLHHSQFWCEGLRIFESCSVFGHSRLPTGKNYSYWPHLPSWKQNSWPLPSVWIWGMLERCCTSATFALFRQGLFPVLFVLSHFAQYPVSSPESKYYWKIHSCAHTYFRLKLILCNKGALYVQMVIT